MKTTVFFICLILQLMCHNFCLNLFVRSKSVSLAHTQGKGPTQGHECQKVGSLGAILEDACGITLGP